MLLTSLCLVVRQWLVCDGTLGSMELETRFEAIDV